MATNEDSTFRKEDSMASDFNNDKSRLEFVPIEPGDDVNKSLRFLQGQMKTFRDEFLDVKFKIDKYIKMSMNDIKSINNDINCLEENKRTVDLLN